MFLGLMNTMAVPMGFVHIPEQEKFCQCHLNNRPSIYEPDTMESNNTQGASYSALPDLVVSQSLATSPPVQQTRTFVFPSEWTDTWTTTSTSTQTTPSLTRTPSHVLQSTTSLESPATRFTSSTIFILPSTPASTSPSTSRTESVSRLTESTQDIDRVGPLDSSGSALKQRRSKSFGYTPAFESNIYSDPGDTESPKADTLATETQSSETSNIGPSALIIANLVLPRDSDLFEDTESTNGSSRHEQGDVEAQNSLPRSRNRSSSNSSNDFLANHCAIAYIPPASLDESYDASKISLNLSHVIAIQDRLKSDPYYDLPNPNATMENKQSSTQNQLFETLSPLELNRRLFDRFESENQLDSAVTYRHGAPSRRLLNDRNQLRLSWELPPSPPPAVPLPHKSPQPLKIPLEFCCERSTCEDPTRESIMRSCGEDLRGIADQFEESRRENSGRTDVASVLSEALLNNREVGKCVAISILAVVCVTLGSKFMASHFR
ncbi:endochitinase A [Hyalella azteca]|uniref:Endochitinase A n=1 Tax=Hyalella azteca TaxID=294128 RepID=A0A8B7PET5_HYAAZ|nr:endochitinase A [Hyalella azteca]